VSPTEQEERLRAVLARSAWCDYLQLTSTEKLVMKTIREATAAYAKVLADKTYVLRKVREVGMCALSAHGSTRSTKDA
jgi:hypothetical protein